MPLRAEARCRQGYPKGNVQQPPQPAQPAEGCLWNGIQQVVPGDNGNGQGRQDSARHVDQSGHQHHAQAQDPDDLQQNGIEMFKMPGRVDQRQFQENQPQSSREQIAGKLGARAALATI